MRVFYDTERECIVHESEIRSDWSKMSQEEKAEYQFCFGKYLKCCMEDEGGTLMQFTSYTTPDTMYIAYAERGTKFIILREYTADPNSHLVYRIMVDEGRNGKSNARDMWFGEIEPFDGLAHAISFLKENINKLI